MPRAPKHCGHTGCTTLTTEKFCPPHKAQRQARAGRTTRGYGKAHQAARAANAPAVEAGKVNCWRCGEPIIPGSAWHQGHDDDDRTVYRGPEHARCNTSAAGRKSHDRT